MPTPEAGERVATLDRDDPAFQAGTFLDPEGGEEYRVTSFYAEGLGLDSLQSGGSGPSPQDSSGPPAWVGFAVAGLVVLLAVVAATLVVVVRRRAV